MPMVLTMVMLPVPAAALLAVVMPFMLVGMVLMSMVLTMVMLPVPAATLLAVVMSFMLVGMVLMPMVLTMVMLPVPTAALLVVVMFLLGMGQKFRHHLIQSVRALYGLQDCFSVQIRQRRCDNYSLRIVFTHQPDTFLQFFRAHLVRPAQQNRPRILNLVDKKLSKILNIHFRLGGIHHRHRAVDLHIQVSGHIFHRFKHIGELSHTRRLNQNTIRPISLDHFLQRSPEIPHQGAADTPGIHLLDLNARLLQKASVNADLPEFIFNQHRPAAIQNLLQQLFNQSGLPRSQKT